MKRTLLTITLFFVVAYSVCAQDFAYGQISAEDLKMTSYTKDTSAHAVVLQEYGKSRINLDNSGDLKLFFEYHVRIKIFDSKGFDEATAEIKLRNSSDKHESDDVDGITGATYFLDASGEIKHVDFDRSKVYTTRDSKEQSTLKFTMPALTNGCIIEYKYTLTSPINLCLYHFHPWYFQSDIPKIFSEYEALIPGHFIYNATLHGYLKLTKSDGQVDKGCFTTGYASSDCSDIKYGMSDIPAFTEEDYMTSSKNYNSSITFDIVEFTNPFTLDKVKETKEWDDIDNLLKSEPDFGGQLKRTSVFKDRMIPVTAGTANDLDKAKAIYAYIQKNFKLDIGADLGVKKAYETHTGSVWDINFSLIDALNSTGINAEAVLLSTRENGFINELYPAINDFNYLVAMVSIGDKSYFLDATDPLLPFGMLPFKCLNGKGRAFTLKAPSYWVDLNVPEKEISTSNLDLTLQDDGKLKGTLIIYSIGYQAFETRAAIKKFNSVDEYVEDVGAKVPKLKILKSEIINSDSLDKPVIEKYEVELKVLDNSGSGKYSFNPFFLSKITTNPLKEAERHYPVDMGMPIDYRTVLTMHLPANYKIDSPPQNVTCILTNNGGKFMTDYQADNNTFTFSHIIQFTKAAYAPEEYTSVKEFFNKIIQSEKAEMIIEKK